MIRCEIPSPADRSGQCRDQPEMPNRGPADSRPRFVLFPFGGAAKELRVMVEAFPPVPLAIGSLARPLPRHPG